MNKNSAQLPSFTLTNLIFASRHCFPPVEEKVAGAAMTLAKKSGA